MTIKRTLFGTEVSIELTDEEVNEIYDDVRIARLTDDILEKYSGIHGDAPSNEVFDHILQDYKEYIEDAMYCDSCGRVGPISNHLAELCEDNPPAKPKRKYNVHYTMLYSKDVEV